MNRIDGVAVWTASWLVAGLSIVCSGCSGDHDPRPVATPKPTPAAHSNSPEPTSRAIARHPAQYSSGGIFSIAVTKDGKRVASASQEHNIIIWDIATGKELSRYALPYSSSEHFQRIRFSPDESQLLACDDHGEIHVWRIGQEKPLRSWRFRSEATKSVDGYKAYYMADISDIAVSPDGSTVIAGGRVWGGWGPGYEPGDVEKWKGNVTPAVALWNIADGKLIKTISTESIDVSSVAFLAHGKQAVLCETDGHVDLVDLATGKTIRSTTLDGGIRSAAVMPDESSIPLGSNKTIYRMGLRDNSEPVDLYTVQDGVGGFSLSISADGHRAICSSTPNNNKAFVWDIEAGKLIHVLNHTHDLGITAVAMLPDGEQAITADSNELRLWTFGATDSGHPAAP